MVQSSYKQYYLDCGGDSFIKQGENWCPYISWKSIYATNITTAMPSIPKECHKSFIGATAAVWTEQTNSESIITKLFPRSFALAERLWLDPPAGSVGDISLWIKAQSRLRILSDKNMLAKCYPVEALQPALCTTHPDLCD